MTVFALWDMDTGNLVRTFDNETALVDSLAAAHQTHGSTYLCTLSLTREAEGEGKVILEGDHLARLADRLASATAE